MRNIKRLFSFVLAFTLSLTLFLTGCGSSKESGDAYVFKIGTANGSLCLAPLHIAADNGYFEEEFNDAGIQYELVEIDMQQTADLVASGQIDACVGLAGSLIPQVDSGLEITFTAGLHTGCTKYYVSADSDIDDLSDLKGKKIGVPGMSDSSVVALKRKLADLGIGVSTNNMEIELVVYNLTDLPLALANGAVDAVALHDPVAASAEAEYGFTKILDLTEDEKFKDEYCCAAFVTTSAASEHPEAAAAYTRALMKASAYVQAEPENTAKLQIENEQCSGDLENNAKLLASYNYQPSVSVMEETFRNACTDLLAIGDLQEGRDIEEFTSEHTVEFEGVPDSYIYNEDGTFSIDESKKNDFLLWMKDWIEEM
ncbi:MAG: ABC transporter substrate-binding protein [Ruminococcus sp.]|nr:ABC transporter substrate-binding protein [Ruminococcus sp.]